MFNTLRKLFKKQKMVKVFKTREGSYCAYTRSPKIVVSGCNKECVISKWRSAVLED